MASRVPHLQHACCCSSRRGSEPDPANHPHASAPTLSPAAAAAAAAAGPCDWRGFVCILIGPWLWPMSPCTVGLLHIISSCCVSCVAVLLVASCDFSSLLLFASSWYRGLVLLVCCILLRWILQCRSLRPVLSPEQTLQTLPQVPCLIASGWLWACPWTFTFAPEYSTYPCLAQPFLRPRWLD